LVHPFETSHRTSCHEADYTWVVRFVHHYSLDYSDAHRAAVTVDVVGLQTASERDAGRIFRMHRRAHQYPNETEHLYSFLQIMTACTASFAHGANDVSNAIGPFAAIYEIWHTSKPVGDKSTVPVWMLAFGGGCIVLGLATCESIRTLLVDPTSNGISRWLQYHESPRQPDDSHVTFAWF
jgi:phosphate/sulfate permease